MKWCMRILTVLLAAAVGGLPSPAQTLAEAARKEAERRKALERQGVEGKVVGMGDPASLAPNGNLSTSGQAPDRGPAPREVDSRGSPAYYRSRIERLDREIRQGEERLKLLKDRDETARKDGSRGSIGGRGGSGSAAEQLRRQIADLDLRLKQMRVEREEVYANGRRAGFLPGELEGRGVVP